MESERSIAAVVCAAGLSSRMGGVKKEYLPFKTKTVLEAAVSAFAVLPDVKTIVITVPEDGEKEAANALSPELIKNDKPKIFFVTGGESRRASVFNALLFLRTYNPCYVLIHDGARPRVTPSLIKNVIQAAEKYDAVIPALSPADTPKECDSPFSGTEPSFIERHLKRARTVLAQTPQCFKFPKILHAHEKAAKDYILTGEDFTDDAEVWGKFCGKVAVIPGDPNNRKITYKEDLL